MAKKRLKKYQNIRKKYSLRTGDDMGPLFEITKNIDDIIYNLKLAKRTTIVKQTFTRRKVFYVFFL